MNRTKHDFQLSQLLRSFTWGFIQGRVGGVLRVKKNALAAADRLEKQRFTQTARPEKCTRLYNQRIMYAAIPPHAKSTGLPCSEACEPAAKAI